MTIGKKERLRWQERLGRLNREVPEILMAYLVCSFPVQCLVHGTQWNLAVSTILFGILLLLVGFMLIPHGIWKEGSTFSKAWHTYDRELRDKSLLNVLLEPRRLWKDCVHNMVPVFRSGGVYRITHQRQHRRINHLALARRTSAGHGAATKAGDDGDGDGGDGEPPRPRSSHTPTPPLHHSLTHSLIFVGGAQ